MTRGDRIVSDVVYWCGVAFILACFVLALVGCGGEVIPAPICEEPEVDSSSSYIVGGEPSVDARATVYVLLEDNRYCTGTVIGPSTVLTAGHCRGPLAVDGVPVASTLTHPRYSFPRNDLQIVYLDGALDAPIAGIAEDLSECVGLIAQGYGWGSDGALHERRVDGFEGQGYIYTTEGPCFGDSGSGLYTVGTGALEIVGTLSFGTSDDCLGSNAGFTDLRLHTDWIYANLDPEGDQDHD